MPTWRSDSTADAPRKGWVEISVDDEIVAFLMIGEDGAPKKFHRVFDGITVTFGPLVERGQINFPATGAFEDGEPFDLIAFEILELTPVEPFERPEPGDSGVMKSS